jgi:aquaporin Z
MLNALAEHWPEYLSEGTLLGLFMVAACSAVVVFQHPASPVARAIRGSLRRRTAIGLLMGLTAVALIYSPWGQRSGAHMNPATTLTFYALGKVNGWDTIFYILAQFAGGLAGVRLAGAVLGHLVRHSEVNHAATLPGARGAGVAWLAEFTIALSLMSMVLHSTNHVETAPYTGLFAGAMVASFIAVEAPLSGMSMNPARTLGSALPARAYRGLWVYFTAPPLAMLAAAWVYTSLAGPGSVYCAKLDHDGPWPCIFHCRIGEMPGRNATPPRASGIR